MKRIKSTEKILRHNCPTCSATYTLLETHLTQKDLTICQANCLKVWKEILNRHCQEKILGQELEESQEENQNNHGKN